MATKRVLKCLSIEEKYNLIKEFECALKKKEASEKYDIPGRTASKIFKNKESIITSIQIGIPLCKKRIKTPKFDNIDKAVLDWFTASRNANMPISGSMEFANRFGDYHFMASTGWLDKWKQKPGVGYKKACGEGNSVSEVDCEKWKKDILPNNKALNTAENNKKNFSH